MKIPGYRPPNQTDFPEMPKGVEEPLKVVSKHLTDITNALQGGLTAEDNFDAEPVTIPIEHNTPVTVTLGKTGSRPVGVSLIDVSGGQIGIAKLDNVAEKKVTVRVWLLSEAPGTFIAKLIIWKGGA